MKRNLLTGLIIVFLTFPSLILAEGPSDSVNINFGIQAVLPTISVYGNIQLDTYGGRLIPGTTTYNLGVTKVILAGGNCTPDVKVVGADNSDTYNFASDNPTNNQYVVKMKNTDTSSSNWTDYPTLLTTTSSETLKENCAEGTINCLSAIWLGPVMDVGNVANQATITFSVVE